MLSLRKETYLGQSIFRQGQNSAYRM